MQSGSGLKHLRTFAATVQVAEIRTAIHRGSDHLVVPVVAMVGDEVYNYMGSPGPELMPAYVLAKAPAAWAGRPVISDHPTDSDGNPVIANTPEYLASEQFGEVFDPRFEDNKLKFDAYLNPEDAERVGLGAAAVVASAEAGEMVEISIGAMVLSEVTKGESNGDKYTAIVREIWPDHLAMGLNGKNGACSNKTGCGAPRAAQEKEPMEKPSRLRSLMASIFSAFVGESQNEVWAAISAALREVNRDAWTEDVYPDASEFVYSLWSDDSLKLFRLSYTITDGKATLGDDAIEQKRKVEYVAATEATPAASSGVTAGTCSCNQDKGEPMSKTIKDLVARLVASEHSPFTDEDQTALEAFGEEKLTAMAAQCEPNPEPKGAVEPEPKPEPAPKADPNTLNKDSEEYAGMKAAADAYEAQQAEEKAKLVTAIGAATDAYTEDELKAKSVEDLTKLRGALKLDAPAPNYELGALPANGDSTYQPPDAYGLNDKEEGEAN